MNTIRSTWLGWGALCVAGGGAYYFAKKEINAERAAKHNAIMKKQARLERIESSSTGRQKARQTDPNSGTHNSKGLDHAGSPSSEISEDVAPVGHAPENAEQRISQKSKYEAAEPFRSKKGDRFS